MLTPLPFLLLLLVLSRSSRAQDVSCGGSSLCPLTSQNGELIDFMWEVLYNSSLQDSTEYSSGDHIICVDSSFDFSLFGIVDFSLGSGGICLFPQSNSLPITLDDALNYAALIGQAGCSACGSVQMLYTDSDSGETYSDGVLKFDYVANLDCSQACIEITSADDQDGQDTGGSGGKQLPSSSAFVPPTMASTSAAAAAAATQSTMSEAPQMTASTTQYTTAVVVQTQTAGGGAEATQSAQPSSSEGWSVQDSSYMLRRSVLSLVVLALVFLAF